MTDDEQKYLNYQIEEIRRLLSKDSVYTLGRYKRQYYQGRLDSLENFQALFDNSQIEG